MPNLADAFIIVFFVECPKKTTAKAQLIINSFREISFALTINH